MQTLRVCIAVFMRTRELLAPRDPDQFSYTWVFKITSLLGLGFLAFAQLRWDVREESLAYQLDDFVSGNAGIDMLMTIPLYAAGALVLGTLVMFSATRPGYRRENARFLAIPLAKLGASAGVVLAFVGLGLLLRPTMDLSTTRYESASEMWQMVLLPVAVVLVLAMAALFLGGLAVLFTFMVALAISASRDLFGAQDGHPCLRPLVSLILAIWSGYLGCSAFIDPDSAASLPFLLSILVLVGGPTFNAAAAIVEIRWLQVAGFSLRLPKNKKLLQGVKA